MSLGTVLVATDFSDAAHVAAERALLLAAAAPGSRLEILHAIDRLSLQSLRRLLASSPADAERELVEKAGIELRHLSESLPRNDAASIETQVVIGNVAEEIARRADELDASLVVMGARGANFVREAFLGTTAEKVVRKTSRPLLVVRSPGRQPYRRVLVPVDFSPHSRHALETARAIAPQAVHHVLHAFEVPFEGQLRYASVDEDTVARYRIQARALAEQDLDRFLRTGSAVRRMIVHGYPPRVIAEAEREIADLVVMGKHGQSALEDLIVCSVSEHVLAHARCDVLVAGRAPASGR
jgi:nucleotide-binding universal stress UspA family protein